jgi:hypothetical protein
MTAVVSGGDRARDAGAVQSVKQDRGCGGNGGCDGGYGAASPLTAGLVGRGPSHSLLRGGP